MHALCASEGRCPALGCRGSVRFGTRVRVRKLRDVREEMKVIVWLLVTVIVWTAVGEEWCGLLRMAEVEWEIGGRPVAARSSRARPVLLTVANVAPRPELVSTPAARGRISLRFATEAVHIGAGDRLEPVELVFENERDVPALLLEDTRERGFAAFEWTVATPNGAPVMPRFRAHWMDLDGYRVRSDSFVVLPAHARTSFYVRPFSGDFLFSPGVYRLGVRYVLSPDPQRVQDETAASTGDSPCEPGFCPESEPTPFDAPGVQALMSAAEPLELCGSNELLVVVHERRGNRVVRCR